MDATPRAQGMGGQLGTEGMTTRCHVWTTTPRRPSGQLGVVPPRVSPLPGSPRKFCAPNHAPQNSGPQKPWPPSFVGGEQLDVSVTSVRYCPSFNEIVFAVDESPFFAATAASFALPADATTTADAITTAFIIVVDTLTRTGRNPRNLLAVSKFMFFTQKILGGRFFHF